MTVQFAGSSSSGSRRRRRIAVSADATGVEVALRDGEPTEFESELVASEAAVPWVPATEFRIWIYASLLLLLAGLCVTPLIYPVQVPAHLSPLAEHWLGGPQPLVLTVFQSALLVVSAQIAFLIGWYRSRCKLDFSGRYRVWPWVIGLIGGGTLLFMTRTHQVVGQVVRQQQWIGWRAETVAWLVPVCCLALPIVVLIDREMRNSRSGLLVLRMAGLLWLASAMGELYLPELSNYTWFAVARQALPVFASVMLFVGLWHHARIVAYVCPDPPELPAGSTFSLSTVWNRLRAIVFRRSASNEAASVEEEEKPKRRRKKADGDVAAPRRKRRPSTKRAPAGRGRKSVSEDETEDAETPADEDPGAESLTDEQDEANTWESEAVDSPDSAEEIVEPPKPARSSANGRTLRVDAAHPAAIPEPHALAAEPTDETESEWTEESSSTASTEEEWQSPPEPQSTSKRQRQKQRLGRSLSDDWEQSSAPEPAPSPVEQSSSEESEPASDGEGAEDADGGASSDEMKGMSKRQRRELKRQQRGRR